MSAASIATPVPVPIAMPRSAWASAAASLTPSPTIPTRCPSLCRRAISASFSAGLTPGAHVLDADRVGDRARGALVVAGQQRARRSPSAQARDRVPRLRLDRVGERDRADRPPGPLDHDRRAPRALPPLEHRGRLAGPLAAGARPRRRRRPRARLHAAPGLRAELARPGRSRAPARVPRRRPPARQDARSPPPRRRQATARVAVLSRRRPDLRDRQLAGRDGPGLVEHDRVELLASLERLGAVGSAGRGSRRDRSRPGSRQASRARARMGRRRSARRSPRRCRAGGASRRTCPTRPWPVRSQARQVSAASTQHGRARSSVRSRPRAAGALAWTACACSTSATSCESAVSAPTAVARARSTPSRLIVAPVSSAPAALLDRQRLAGQHRLIDRRAARDHDPVDRHLVARAHEEHVAAAHIVDRDQTLGRVRVVGVEQARLRRTELRELADRAAGAAARLGLAPARDQQRGDDDRSHVVVRAAC